MMMNMLNPNQKTMANQFQNKTKEEQAKLIADKANELGLSKEDLQNIINMFNGQ